MLTLSKTCCSTSGSYCRISYLGMSECGVHGLATCLTNTCFRTGRSCLIMSCCGCLAIGVAVAAILTGVSCVTNLGTGGLCYNRLVIVSLRRGLAGFAMIAALTGTFILDNTCCSTSRFLCDCSCIERMAERINIGIGVLIAAAFTFVCGVSLFGTSGIYNLVIVIVGERSNLFNVRFFTYRTRQCLFTLFRTGRFFVNDLGIGMSECGNR